MSKTEQIGNLISDCMNLCRESGYKLETLAYFLDEMREMGHPETDVQHVDGVMRHILKDILVPEPLEVELSGSPTDADERGSSTVVDD